MMLWGIAGFLAGDLPAWQLAFPALNFDPLWMNFGHLRPVHTSVTVLAFGGNALLATSFHAARGTCQTELYGRFAPWFVFIGYNAFIAIAGSAHVLGVSEPREYSAPVWYAGWWLCGQAAGTTTGPC